MTLKISSPKNKVIAILLFISIAGWVLWRMLHEVSTPFIDVNGKVLPLAEAIKAIGGELLTVKNDKYVVKVNGTVHTIDLSDEKLTQANIAELFPQRTRLSFYFYKLDPKLKVYIDGEYQYERINEQGNASLNNVT